MHFRTEIPITQNSEKISLHTPVLTIGSCFAEVIGQKLIDTKISALANPFGTVFNPLSITKLLRQALLYQLPDDALYLENQGISFHYDFHSSWWAATQEELKAQLTQQLHQVRDRLLSAKWLIITLGTAYVYRELTAGHIVANCHKMPNKQFRKELLPLQTITEDFRQLYALLRAANPAIRIILTVSPVRHTRDTLPLNAVSKSILRVACHELSESLEMVSYFPAYELLLDDLRDYRFYKSDLIHPNEMAEEYIFQKFSEAYFDHSLKQFTKEWQKMRQEMAHRPQQPNTAAHRSFLENLLKKLQMISGTVGVDAELDAIQQQLQAIKY
ncbi:GSCFA domain-containing protein [Runella slithyformis]|uniref:GSCFA domain protein n=1 Tax=Runella slithyformis (strain ATCC 29530 / DSM 19594 / LMG 11500 / NCIMB 11436 / LSU 4) TaxID=761193 RepID=A0A7U4E6R1_RUNSL|nr:GSCFA domain-containing protein [Runella slithyformis]AEI49856.1 GSCFA domain protein [Runella slithyformis DSM 19594]